MSVENGEWVMYGVDRDDPSCLHSIEELEAYVDETGFLPLFGNRIPGFSSPGIRLLLSSFFPV